MCRVEKVESISASNTNIRNMPDKTYKDLHKKGSKGEHFDNILNQEKEKLQKS